MSVIARVAAVFVCLVVGTAVADFGTAVAQETAEASVPRVRADAAPPQRADERVQLALGMLRPSEDLERYTGAYLTSTGAVLIVVAEDRFLTIERGDSSEPPVRLVPALDGTTFSSDAFTVVFARAADGSITGLRVSRPGADSLIAVKAPPRRGIVIIEDIIEKAGGQASPAPLPDLPVPGGNRPWSVPFAAVLEQGRGARLGRSRRR